MGVGFYHLIEIHQGTSNGEASLAQQDAPTSPHDPAPTSEANGAPTQEQVQDPPLDQAAMQEPRTHSVDPIIDISQGQYQEQDQLTASFDEDA